MQKIGSGMERMRIVCDEQNCPYPEVDYTDTHFYLNFKPSREYLKMSEAEKPEVGWENELNERQKKAIDFVREKGKITNKDYQELTGVSRITASRELADLVEKKQLRKVGTVGRGTKYIL
ncbi:MAG: ATP-dependent DNA helicase RecG [Candidatus Methanocomedens sp.]|nr:MAG: ATP-dependent DNA helicase RecG [ANME-2 cluster archaeon]